MYFLNFARCSCLCLGYLVAIRLLSILQCPNLGNVLLSLPVDCRFLWLGNLWRKSGIPCFISDNLVVNLLALVYVSMVRGPTSKFGFTEISDSLVVAKTLRRRSFNPFLGVGGKNNLPPLYTLSSNYCRKEAINECTNCLNSISCLNQTLKQKFFEIFLGGTPFWPLEKKLKIKKEIKPTLDPLKLKTQVLSIFPKWVKSEGLTPLFFLEGARLPLQF